MSDACMQLLSQSCSQSPLRRPLPCRRQDIESADKAVWAVAGMLHQLAPNGDVAMAAGALQQVSALTTYFPSFWGPADAEPHVWAPHLQQ